MSNIFTDTRDGQIYKTVEINGKVWLAENLKHEGVKHYVPNGIKDNAYEYGYLYSWADAMQACPEGWHLPSKEEFYDLLKAAGSSMKEQAINLRSVEWGGNNKFGLNILPSGWYNADAYDDYLFKGYYAFGYTAHFWSCIIGTRGSYRLGVGEEATDLDCMPQIDAFSVRCIKN